MQPRMHVKVRMYLEKTPWGNLMETAAAKMRVWNKAVDSRDLLQKIDEDMPVQFPHHLTVALWHQRLVFECELHLMDRVVAAPNGLVRCWESR